MANKTLLIEGTISEKDLKLISIVDTESEVIQIIDKFTRTIYLNQISNKKRPIHLIV